MSESSNQPRLLVLGAGPGGYPAAFHAAYLGMQVTLVDPSPTPGGVCLYRGCIPSKALLHIARVMEETREMAECGISFGELKIDNDKVRAWKNKVIGKLTAGLAQLVKKHRVNFIQGRSRFLDAKTVLVTKKDGAEERVAFDYAVVATGSQPMTLPGIPFAPRVMNSNMAIELPDVPKTLLVVGGGYIGLELGSVYATLGTKVSVVEMLPSLMPGADRDLVEPLQKRLKVKFQEVLLSTRLARIEPKEDRVEVELAALDLKDNKRVYDKVLISVGRKPNTQDLGLEHTQVQLDPKGFVKVDVQRRTTEPNIFAVGDCAGEPMLAHKATHEARVAVETIAGKPAAFDPKVIPAVVFTDPEVAWCGLTETQALTQGRSVKVAKYPWIASGRATTLGRNEGLTKLIVDPRTERVLGVGIVGVSAGEMIAEGALAIEMGAVAADLKLTIHTHPTFAETLMEAAEAFYGHSTHLGQIRGGK